MPNPKGKIASKEIDLRSLARAYTKASIQKLGGYANSDKVEPDIQLRAIGMLLDRGWGKPSQETQTQAKGEIRVVLRKMLKDED